jgi:hypothetical protein
MTTLGRRLDTAYSEESDPDDMPELLSASDDSDDQEESDLDDMPELLSASEDSDDQEVYDPPQGHHIVRPTIRKETDRRTQAVTKMLLDMNEDWQGIADKTRSALSREITLRTYDLFQCAAKYRHSHNVADNAICTIHPRMEDADRRTQAERDHDSAVTVTHLEDVAQERLLYYLHRDKARRQPENFMSMNEDSP